MSAQDWREMGRADFDAAEPLILFGLDELGGAMTPRSDDECGTPDLFSV
jgi:hypothetical protein